MASRLRAGTRLILRLSGVLFLIPVSVVEAVFLACAAALAPRFAHRVQPPMMRAWFRVLARLWGLSIEVRGAAAPGPALLASNHRSWLDILVLGATLEATFVSKAELDRWPLVGYLARHGGRTLYISRGEMRSFNALGGRLIGRLREGGRVVFFPEGTVSGERLLLRFRPRLFAAAVAADCPVQPVAIAYTDGDGAATAPQGPEDMFGPHALRMLRCRRTGVRVDFLAPIASTGVDEKTLAARARAGVAAVVLPAHMRNGDSFAGTLGAMGRRNAGNG